VREKERERGFDTRCVLRKREVQDHASSPFVSAIIGFRTLSFIIYRLGSSHQVTRYHGEFDPH